MRPSISYASRVFAIFEYCTYQYPKPLCHSTSTIHTSWHVLLLSGLRKALFWFGFVSLNPSCNVASRWTLDALHCHRSCRASRRVATRPPCCRTVNRNTVKNWLQAQRSEFLNVGTTPPPGGHCVFLGFSDKFRTPESCRFFLLFFDFFLIFN